MKCGFWIFLKLQSGGLWQSQPPTVIAVQLFRSKISMIKNYQRLVSMSLILHAFNSTQKDNLHNRNDEKGSKLSQNGRTRKIDLSIFICIVHVSLPVYKFLCLFLMRICLRWTYCECASAWFSLDSINIKILNAGAWSRGSERVTVSLPMELEDYIPEVEEFYKSKHSGRKLQWHHHMSNGTVSFNHLLIIVQIPRKRLTFHLMEALPIFSQDRSFWRNR